MGNPFLCGSLKPTEWFQRFATRNHRRLTHWKVDGCQLTQQNMTAFSFNYQPRSLILEICISRTDFNPNWGLHNVSYQSNNQCHGIRMCPYLGSCSTPKRSDFNLNVLYSMFYSFRDTLSIIPVPKRSSVRKVWVRFKVPVANKNN